MTKDLIEENAGTGPTLHPSASIPTGDPQSASATGNYVTLPADFPAITVTAPANDTAPGLLFAATFIPTAFGKGERTSYLLILEDTGQPVYYQRLPNDLALDFKVLSDGTLSYFDSTRNLWVIMDDSYREMATVRPGNGLNAADPHELQLLENGHYLIMADQLVTIDMSKRVPGGLTQTPVLQQIVQEVDVAGMVYFNWPILKYVPLTDTNQSLTEPTISPGQGSIKVPVVGYSHCNAIEVDTDGNLLLCCRGLDSIIKINRANGAIMWRLGGKANNFRFALGPGVPITEPVHFYYQHDIRRLPNGNITLFDNHSNPGPQHSRALEYELDEQNLTATLVRALHHSPDTYSRALGNVQTLPNGNRMVGWGLNAEHTLTEYHPDGRTAFEMHFGNRLISYRALRFPWHGHPAWPPAMVLQPANNVLNLIVSWNGATDVVGYRIFGGASSPDTLLGTEARTGFETRVALQGAQASYRYYQVVPVDLQGQPMQASDWAENPVAASCP